VRWHHFSQYFYSPGHVSVSICYSEYKYSGWISDFCKVLDLLMRRVRQVIFRGQISYKKDNMDGIAKYLSGFVIVMCLFNSTQVAADIKGGQAAILKGDFPTAFREFMEDANKGVAHAQAAVGVMLHLGQGVKRDLKKALSWYRKAGENGYEAGLANVGIMYYKGAGIQNDDVQAYAWLDVASYIRGGREHNAKSRVASYLSPQQLNKAKKLALKYRQKYAKK
jgi:hypothetical protein